MAGAASQDRGPSNAELLINNNTMWQNQMFDSQNLANQTTLITQGFCNTNNNIEKATKILKKSKMVLMIMAVVMCLMTNTVFAASPLDTINSLSDFIFSAIKAIGLILLGFGIVQIGLSLKSHDASQRANGFLTFFGGVIIAFAKDILDMIM